MCSNGVGSDIAPLTLPKSTQPAASPSESTALASSPYVTSPSATPSPELWRPVVDECTTANRFDAGVVDARDVAAYSITTRNHAMGDAILGSVAAKSVNACEVDALVVAARITTAGSNTGGM